MVLQNDFAFVTGLKEIFGDIAHQRLTRQDGSKVARILKTAKSVVQVAKEVIDSIEAARIPGRSEEGVEDDGDVMEE